MALRRSLGKSRVHVNTGGKLRCTKCAKYTGTLSLKEHNKKVHQTECTLTFPDETVTVKRSADGQWRCPRCKEACGKHPRRFQDHAKKQKCNGLGSSASSSSNDEHEIEQRSSSILTGQSPRAAISRSSSADTPSSPLSSISDVNDNGDDSERCVSIPPVEVLDSYIEGLHGDDSSPSDCISRSMAAESVESPSDRSVKAFLASLKRPSEDLIEVFREIGVESARDLDTLCTFSQEQIHDVKQYLLGRGISLFLWLVVVEGLDARAKSLSCSTDEGTPL